MSFLGIHTVSPVVRLLLLAYLLLPSSILAFLPLVAESAVHAGDPATPGVLILHSNQRPTPAGIVIDDTLRTVVPSGLKRPVELYSEYLDDEWTSLEMYGASQAEFLWAKYGRRNVRVVVVVALPALQFATKFRDRIFAGVPVIHLAVAPDRLAGAALPASVAGVFEDLDPTPTLQLALRLHPDTRRVVLVRGADQRDGMWDKRMHIALGQLGSGLEVEHLSGLPTAAVLRHVAALAHGTIVFTPGYFVDGAGQVSTPRQSVERIAQASAVPVYGTFDTLLGSGIVGGYMTPYKDQAARAGAIVVGLLNGAPLPASSYVARTPMVDWRQVRRWGMDERMLPADTVVTFREPTAWDRYWREISIGLAVVALQMALIAALLVERRMRRRTAAALETSERSMDLAARAAKLTTWIWDAARDRFWLAPGYGRRGATPSDEQLTLADALKDVHPADRGRVESAARHALASNEDMIIEYRVIGRDRETRWIAARGKTDEPGGRRLLGVAMDVTGRKTAELEAERDRAALRHMTRVSLLGQLSASIAHEINQPLATILNNAEAVRKMLARGRVDVAELREICDDIVAEDHRAASVIRRLRTLFKGGDIPLQPLDVNELIQDTLALLHTELLMRHVVAITDLASSLPAVGGVRVQLQQVLLNLFMNSADAMEGNPVGERQLVVATAMTDAGVRICVSDCGPGIAEADLKNIFEPFWSSKPGGMGMGLAICRSIVAAHGGSLTAVNGNDRGATFCVVLPARQAA